MICLKTFIIFGFSDFNTWDEWVQFTNTGLENNNQCK